MAVLIGSTATPGGTDAFLLDEVAATQYTATANGSAASMSVAIRSGTSCTSMVLGIYSNAAGVPNTLLGQTVAFNPGSATAVKSAALVSPVTIVSGTVYHLAALSLAGGPWNYTGASSAGYRNDAAIGGAFEATWDVTGDSTGGVQALPITADSGVGFVGAGSGAAGSGAAPTAPGMPTAAAAGDLLLYQFATRDAATLTTPGGWNVVHTQVNGTTLRSVVYWRIMQGGDTIPAVVRDVDTAAWIARVTAWRGADQTAPIDNAPTPNANGSTQNIAVPGLTPNTDNCMIVGWGDKADDTGVGTAGYNSTDFAALLADEAGVVWDQAYEGWTGSGSDMMHVMDYGDQATIAAIAAKSFTITGGVTAVNNGGMFSILPSSGTFSTILPDADTTTTGWTSTPLFSKINDASDASVITATLA